MTPVHRTGKWPIGNPNPFHGRILLKLAQAHHIVILLALAAALFGLRLDSALLEPEEARYAEIAREMLDRNELIVPYLHGQPYLDKPPLLYWLTSIAYAIFGVHDWAARMVPAVCGLGTVLVTYGWGRRLFGARTAFLSALILLLTSRFIYLGRFVATDAVLNVFVTMALASVHIALNDRHRSRWWIAAGCACGLGLLAKGPVVLLLVAVPGGFFLFLDRSAIWPDRKKLMLFFATLGAVALPWYCLISRATDFARYFFWQQHVLRFAEPFDHQKPWWFYFPDVALGTVPWCLLLIPLAGNIYRRRHAISQREAPALLYPLLAAGWCLLFFSASGCKRVGYILPLCPPLALVFGNTLDTLIAGGAARRWCVGLLSLALLMVFGGSLLLRAFQYWPAFASMGTVIAVVLLAGGLVIVRRRLGDWHYLTASFLVCGLTFVAAIGWVLPRYNERFSLRDPVMAARVRIDSNTFVACYPRDWDSVHFYLKRDQVRVFTAAEMNLLQQAIQQHDEVLLFCRDNVIPSEDNEWLRRLYPAGRVETLSRQYGHRVLLISRPERQALVSAAASP